VNASYGWLRAFVPFSETPSQLRDLLTSKVATVDELIPLRADLAAIVVARVVEEGPHPDSDHLHLTKVDVGTGELLDVVCGAPNVTAGKLYPFAMTGTVMPSGLKIEKRKIRGVVSNGMICSARELGLGDDHDGVMELSVDVPPGTPFLRAMPVGDSRLVIDVGANRPDLLSHLGIAREIAASTRRPFALPALDVSLSTIPTPTVGKGSGSAGKVGVHVDDPSLVRRFMGAVIRGVTVGPSPQWLVDRLGAIGLRSINNIVDASNYVLHELGQPTHAFDLAKLGGTEVRVRLARSGERIVTLDGTERKLSPEMIVIADQSRPQAIAGVMGGRDSEVTDATTDLFIEVANFDPGRVRAARRALGMNTDASYRFERGVDVEIAPRALERVAQLVIALAGGAIEGSPIDLRLGGATRTQIALRSSRVSQVLGADISVDDIHRHLTSIGFELMRGDKEHSGVTVPSWRPDVTDEIDLIEEIARLYGFDAFSDEIRPFRPGTVPDDPRWLTSRAVRDLLVGRGLTEVRPMPFVAGGDEYVRIANPFAETEAYLRRGVIESLARRAEFNLAHMQRNIRLFEIGDVFLPSDQPLPIEKLHVGVLVMGRRMPRHFTDPGGEDFDRWVSFDQWDVAAIARDLCRAAFPREALAIHPAKPGTSYTTALSVEWIIRRGDTTVGHVGRVNLDAPTWAPHAWGLELSLGSVDSTAPAERGHNAYRRDAIAVVTGVQAQSGIGVVAASGDASVSVDGISAGASIGQVPFRPLPTTPAAEFDLALLLRPGQTAADVEKVIRESAGELLERLELFDEYIGEAIADGMRSVAWRLTFRHPERTLREKEIDGRRAKILSALEKELNVRARTS
jgi:phenylalanyl-tRNA synthetase beta chain